MDFVRVNGHKRAMTKRLLVLATATAAMLAAVPVSAALQEGARAPSFTTEGALAGKTFTFSLQNALSKGPVVLYFFPKAFTPGCSLEAKAFAERISDFKRAGVQVIGMSGDSIEDLKKFSTKECAGKFAVARATPAVIQQFDVAMTMNGQRNENISNRTSYVIGRDGKVVMVHSDLNWEQHVARTLAAAKALKS